MASTKINCPHCPAKVDSRRFEEHLRLCIDSKPYPCEICGKRFPTQKSVKHHVSGYHTANERGTEFKCCYCEHGSNNKKDLEKHQNKHEEAGGIGFRSRSRSRSREPARQFNAQNTTLVSVRNDMFASQSRDENVNRSRSRPVAFKQSTFQIRSRSKPAVDISISQPREGMRPSVFSTSDRYGNSSSHAGMTPPRWALMQPTLNNIANHSNHNLSQQDDDDHHPITKEQSTSAQNGFCHYSGNNTFINGVSNKLIAEQNQFFIDAFKAARKQNKILRRECENAGIELSADQIEPDIREYERLFGALPESDEDENLA